MGWNHQLVFVAFQRFGEDFFLIWRGTILLASGGGGGG